MTREEQIWIEAEKYRDDDFKANRDGYHVSPTCNEDTTADAFCIGAEWADSNPSDKVKALVEALEKIAAFHLPLDLKGNNWPDVKIAREALAKWREE